MPPAARDGTPVGADLCPHGGKGKPGDRQRSAIGRVKEPPEGRLL